MAVKLKYLMEARSCSKLNAPCAGCKLLRRHCSEDYNFTPYFPSTEPEKFLVVHRVFGASNVSKMLQDIAADFRGDAVISMVYEANARFRDGYVASTTALHIQVSQLQRELAEASAETMALRAQPSEALSLLALVST